MAKKPICRARVVPIPAPNAHGYRWQWRSEDDDQVSARAFELFYDCLCDARSHGYEVQLAPPPAGLSGIGGNGLQ